VSDGRYGATGFDFSWDGAWGKKSCVFFDDEIACLGMGIGGNSAERIFTSINQSFLRGDVTVSYDSDSGNIVGRGARALNSPRWVHHDGTGYVFPVAGAVQLKNDTQHGSWGAIYSGLSRARITRDVFSLWFDHGRSPSGQSYAYVLLPNASASQTQSYANKPTVRVVSNTAAQQAVRNDALGITGIVFYAPGTVQIRSGLSVSADQRVIVLVDESVASARVTVAQPENQTFTANITLSGDFNTTLAFNLPGGRSAGSSATMTVTGGIPSPPPPPSPTTGCSDAAEIRQFDGSEEARRVAIAPDHLELDEDGPVRLDREHGLGERIAEEVAGR
jgi:chondroitin AC lyase